MIVRDRTVRLPQKNVPYLNPRPSAQLDDGQTVIKGTIDHSYIGHRTQSTPIDYLRRRCID